ncbi:VOC family protein [Streptomyces sp. NPDC001941]|uniref:VOC family protein n=1 Tax=Streptomyces sp. NPDC001941 TaxID=3154659 RepID=UPI00332A26AE
MPVDLNHTFVYAHDPKASAAFLGEILGLDVAPPFGPFIPLPTSNGVTLDYVEPGHVDGEHERIRTQHYAFIVSEDEFTEIFGRVQGRGIEYFADPQLQRAGEINRNDGGRGVYFADPNGHVMEVITRPYGSGTITANS